MAVWSFHISKYIWPKSTKSILSDILQLCIPTNQLAQPHSQSLNNYSNSAKELAHPLPPDAIRSISTPWLEEIWANRCSGRGVGEVEWRMRQQQVNYKKILIDSSFHQSSCQTHKSRGAAIGFPGIHILMLVTVYSSELRCNLYSSELRYTLWAARHPKSYCAH